jgi:hypothetical protein
MICVALLTVNVVVLLPNFTALALVKFVPVIVTAVAPATGPLFGAIEVTVGGAKYVNRSDALVALVPNDVVTVISTGPAPPGGEAAEIWVSLLTVNEADLAPKFAEVAPVKPVPVMTTGVPPAVEPLFGATPVTIGGGT